MLITNDIHFGSDCFKIETDALELKLLKEFGAKIVSLKHKKTNYEFVFQPSKKRYETPDYSEAFEKYDTSGIDEMLPTIDACKYIDKTIDLPDHGEVWALKWENKIINNKIESSVSSRLLPLNFKRTTELKDDEVIFNYELKNTSKTDVFYLWAFHGLLNFDDKTVINIPKDVEIINVIDNKSYDFDYTKLSQYPNHSTAKFYFKNPLNKGEVSVDFLNKNLKLTYEFDTQINKYLGVWVTKGGFKGEYNFAIEPSSGFYDSLESAYNNQKVSIIKGNQTLKWHLKLKIENMR